MGWRFRKSFKLIPGIRLNISRRGISTTVGSGPFSMNFGPRGVYANASIPGTGVGMRQRIDSPGRSDRSVSGSAIAPEARVPGPIPTQIPPAASIPAEAEVRSAGTESITSEGLEGLREVIRTAFSQRASVQSDLRRVSDATTAAAERLRWWESGFLFKRLRPKRFVEIRDEAETSAAEKAELQEQLELSLVPLEIEASDEQLKAFSRLADDFQVLSSSQRIWDTTSRQAIDRVVHRTTANEVVTRESVRFALEDCDLIISKWKVPHLGNRNGGDLFVYPGFVLYRVSSESFAVMDLREVELEVTPVNFNESEGVPGDAQVVGQSWAKANKDGSPDRRFRDNYQIPVARYVILSLRTAAGLNEQYLISRVQAAEAFDRSWKALKATLPAA